MPNAVDVMDDYNFSVALKVSGLCKKMLIDQVN